MTGSTGTARNATVSAETTTPFANAVRESKCTCRVCAAPVRGFDLCWQCAAHQRMPGTADVVAPLAYAIAGTESALTLSAYKNHPARAERERRSRVAAGLLMSAISLHEDCLGAVVGMAISARVVVPSLTYRPDDHPLTSIVRSVGLMDDLVLVPGPEAGCDRRVRQGKFAVRSAASVAGRHVLVIDDVWTTGSNAQSAALTLRAAGVAAVSMLVVGRWLNPRNTLTRRFIQNRLCRPYDPHVCPVTGGVCPRFLETV